MATTAKLAKLEAQVQVRDAPRQGDAFGDWHDLWHIDPITLPVESGGFTDVFDDDLMTLVENMLEWDDCRGLREFRLVWSKNGHDVRGVCPGCDDVFPIFDGFVADVEDSPGAASGASAVCCGCIDD